MPRLARSGMSHATPLAELRRYYDGLAAELGPVAGDVIVERAQLGQVKGEWVSIADTDPQRLVLYFHGGGYISGSPETYRALVAKLCRVGGAAALSLDYRLGPEFPFPACLRDAVDAYRFLIAKAYPPESVVLAGDGAGGGLAVATMMAIRNGGLPMPAGRQAAYLADAASGPRFAGISGAKGKAFVSGIGANARTRRRSDTAADSAIQF